MQDLTLVGLTEDRSKLVLVSDSGEEYTLAADARLRAALRGDHARLGQLEIQMDSALRPRDIQSRIRSGETPEAVAQAAQTTVDRIMAYAAPVLAERAHVTQRAQRASVRRKSGEGPARLLEDAVTEQLHSRNIDPGSVEWDAWRREDGRWTLVAEYRDGERPRRAELLFDAPGRYVLAVDDEARRLVGEAVQRRTPARDAAGTKRRLAAVGGAEELPLGADAIELVTGHAANDNLGPEQLPLEDGEGLSPHERTADLSRTAEEVRHHDPTGAATGDADWVATQASDRPEAPERTETETLPGAEEPGPEQPAPGQSGPGGHTSDEQEPAPRRSGRRGRRASVPSWDEIMFGGGRSD
jgi:hypothetical protein